MSGPRLILTIVARASIAWLVMLASGGWNAAPEARAYWAIAMIVSAVLAGLLNGVDLMISDLP